MPTKTDSIQSIKDNLDIVDVVGTYVQLKRRGRNLFGLCPFHGEKSPSFSVNEDLQIFKCFGCGKSGDMFTFVQEVEHVDFKDAIEILAKKAGITIEKSDFPKYSDDKKIIIELNELATKVYEYTLTDMKAGDTGRKYAEKRGLTPDLIKSFRLGFAPQTKDYLMEFLIKKKGYKQDDIIKAGLGVIKNGKIEDKFKNRLMFPVINNMGEVVAFSGRYIGDMSGSFAPPKYLNSPETAVFHKSKILFGLYQAKDDITHKDSVIISEGQMNIVSSHKVEHKNIVASMGTSLTIDHLKILARYTNNILFCFDKDKAGQTALMRSLILANQLDLNTKVVSLSIGKDPDEEISKDANKWNQDIDNASDAFDYLLAAEIQKHKNSQNEDILNILKELKPYLLSITNPIKKELYEKSIEKELGVSTQTIRKYLESGQSEKPVERVPVKTEVNEVAKISGVHLEEFFLALLMQNWEVLKVALIAVDAKYFSNEKYVEFILKAVFGVDMSVEELMDSLDENEKKIAEDAMLKFIPIDERTDLGRTFIDLYKRIKVQSIKTKVSKLKAELYKSPENPEEITSQINELINEMSEGN